MDTVNGLSAAQVQELLQPLEYGDHVEEKDGQYRLRHRYIRARLTQIYGFNGWGEQDLELTLIHENTDKSTGETVVASRARQRLIIRNPDGSVRTSYDGAGSWGTAATRSKRAAVWEIHSDAMNGARSVAFCRAAMSLGQQFGLSLYTENGAHDQGEFTVGYSLPHQSLSHLYGAGDIEGEQEEIPGVDVPETEHTAQDPA